MSAWQLQHAKARFSEVVKKAITEGPQNISLHGKVAAIVISKEEYDRLTQPKKSLIQFLRSSPLMGLKLNIKRDKSPTRDIDL